MLSRYWFFDDLRITFSLTWTIFIAITTEIALGTLKSITIFILNIEYIEPDAIVHAKYIDLFN